MSNFHSATCIDHVYSNISTEDIESIIIESDASDHYSTLTKIYDFHTNKKDSDIFYRKTNLSDDDWTLFNSDLQYALACNLPHDRSINDVNVNDYANLLTDSYKTLINKYMPLRQGRRKWVGQAHPALQKYSDF